MESGIRKIAVRTMLLVLLLSILLPLLASRQTPDLALDAAPPAFNGLHALQLTREFVTQFPTRVFGSLESRQSTGFLHDYLSNLGYEVEYAHFDGRIGKRKQAGRNVLAFKRGKSAEILALVAHFDTARPVREGAVKNGAAVGVLLELARVFAKESTHRSLLIVFADGGEWGATGSQDLATHHARRDRMAAVLSLDHVGSGDLAGLRLEATGQLEGYTPPWLRSLARRAAGAQGLPIASAAGLKEHMDRALLISQSDQGPFLKAGIPAINLGSIAADQPREKAILHSPQDTVGNLKLHSISQYGLAAERLARSLDRMPSIPRQSSDGLRVWGARFLNMPMVRLLHVLLFLPLGVVCFLFLKLRPDLHRMGRELLAFSVTFVPFWVLYLSIRLAHALRLFPLYDLYPAAAKDPLILNPPWKLLGGIFGATLFIAVAAYIICKYALRDWPKPDYAAAKTMLLGLTCILAALALVYNSFWAVLFLAVPAWIWPMINSAQTGRRKFRNACWLLVPAIPCLLAAGLMASQMGMHWNIGWYYVLAISTRLFSPAAYFLGAAAIALGIRFLAIQGHGHPS